MKHLLENKTCKSLCDKGCFQVIDYASSTFRLKVSNYFFYVNYLAIYCHGNF